MRWGGGQHCPSRLKHTHITQTYTPKGSRGARRQILLIVAACFQCCGLNVFIITIMLNNVQKYQRMKV